MTECNCVIKPDEGRDDTVCNEPGPMEALCSKPEGHEGPHAACTVNAHPVEVWYDECEEHTPHTVGGDDEPERLDNPAWKDRMRHDEGDE